MVEAVFFRLLQEDVEDKPAALEAKIAALNIGEITDSVFGLSQHAFEDIPRSPFAYWTPQSFRDLFKVYPKANDMALIGVGASTKNDFKYLRLWYEVLPASVATQRESTLLGKRWVGFAKGGAYSQFYSDIYLMLDWLNDGIVLKEEIAEYRGSRGWGYHWTAELKKHEHYFRFGLTWSRRSQKGLSLRALPAGCVFADKGPAVFVANDDVQTLQALLGVTNSAIFRTLVELQMAFGSYEVGVIQRTPVPDSFGDELAPLALRAHDLQRERSLTDETTHVFQLPALVAVSGDSLNAASVTLAAQADERTQQFAAVQTQIDEIVFDLYGLSDEDRQLVMREMGTTVTAEGVIADEDEPEEDDEATAPNDLPAQVMNLLMWCVGVAFGRWDVRKALDPSLLPPLPEPFDPLPRCTPGALMNADGLPAAQADVPGDYPLPIAWDGILVDDPAQEANPHSLDIVARVRGVITLLWGDHRADAIEAEICRVLEKPDLRAIFRDARQGLFAFHIKRYSKSRRKAPIYWLLQTGARTPNYGLWLYYPRIDGNTLFIAEDIAYKKILREADRLNELKQGLEGLDRAARKQRDAEITAQTRLVDEVTGFHSKVRQLANLGLPPDHNDGVLISIAPLHELVPWKEAAAMWTKLTRGEYRWSTMSQRMNARGLITGKG